MSQTLTVTEAIKTLRDVETCFNLHRNSDQQFFSEWYEDLADLSQEERTILDRIKNSYLYNSTEGALTEATINLLLISPLLYLSGFCDPPFQIRAEKSVTIEVFVKVVQSAVNQYGFSTDFSVYGLPDNELYDVLKVMKRIGEVIKL